MAWLFDVLTSSGSTMSIEKDGRKGSKRMTLLWFCLGQSQSMSFLGFLGNQPSAAPKSELLPSRHQDVANYVFNKADKW